MAKPSAEAKDTKRITVTFSPATYNAIRESAQADRRSIAAQVLTLLEEALESRARK